MVTVSSPLPRIFVYLSLAAGSTEVSSFLVFSSPDQPWDVCETLPKSPARDFVDSLYWLEGKPEIPDDATEEEVMALYYEAVQNGARFGFPSTGLKQAAISAVYRMGWSKDKVSWRGAFFIEGEMLEIKSDTPEIREDMVRVGMGTADIRYRGQLNNWSTEFNLIYNVNGLYDLDAIVNAINAGGLLCGIGEWRPEKDGDFGRFHVAF